MTTTKTTSELEADNVMLREALEAADREMSYVYKRGLVNCLADKPDHSKFTLGITTVRIALTSTADYKDKVVVDAKEMLDVKQLIKAASELEDRIGHNGSGKDNCTYYCECCGESSEFKHTNIQHALTCPIKRMRFSLARLDSLREGGET